MVEREYKYIVTLRHLHIELASNQISKDNELWCLSSNLIDLSSYNTRQAISYFTLSKGKVNFDIVPLPLVFYPLEKHQLENPHFVVERITEEKILNIKNAFVQIEITKCSE